MTDHLTYEQAVEQLADGETVHVVSNSAAGLLMGADWPRDKVLEHFRTHAIETAGPTARAGGHGLASVQGERRLFFATKPQETTHE